MAKRKSRRAQSESLTDILVNKVLDHVVPRAWDFISRKFWEVLDKAPPSESSDFEQQQFTESATSTKKTRRKRQPSPWWKVLGVSEFSSLEEIKRAYKEAMTKTHPDKVEHLSEKLKAAAAKEAKRLNAAFDEAKAARRIG